MKNIPIHWRIAVITGAVLIAWMLFEYTMGWHHSLIGAKTNIFNVVIFLIGLFVAIRQTRDVTLKGFIDIKIGMLVGLQFALITGVIGAIGVFLYYQFINPDYAAYWAKKSEEAMLLTHTKPELITQTKFNIMASFTPIKQATQRLFFSIMGGAFSSIVLSFLLKNTKVEA
jgi:hypothetical protein